ncbi:MAG: hypothetical protein LUG98_15960, partial [Tannerellaceae bacterium]|nr:hypothetical protein [Tannerellaceae bacterium]
MKTWIYSLTFVLFFLFYSCDNQTKEALRTAEAFLEENPDSALFYLESIPAPELLSPKDYNDYLLLLVQAKDKAAEDISKDSLIFTLKGYYKKKDPVKDAQVSFYCGKIKQKNKEYENAMQHYLEAEQAIENTDREDIKGLIQFGMGSLFYNQFLWDESIEKFKG